MTPKEKILTYGELLSVRPIEQPVKIKLLSGALWITIEGEARDLTPHVGEILILPHGLLSVIQALSSKTCIELYVTEGEEPKGRTFVHQVAS